MYTVSTCSALFSGSFQNGISYACSINFFLISLQPAIKGDSLSSVFFEIPINTPVGELNSELAVWQPEGTGNPINSITDPDVPHFRI